MSLGIQPPPQQGTGAREDVGGGAEPQSSRWGVLPLESRGFPGGLGFGGGVVSLWDLFHGGIHGGVWALEGACW